MGPARALVASGPRVIGGPLPQCPAVPLLVLTAIDSGEALEFRDPEIRIGRDPASTIAVAGAQSRVVSMTHARLIFDSGRWWLEDAGSRNGTFVGARRLETGERYALAAGTGFRLGSSGPQYRVERTGEVALGATMVEGSADAMSSTVVESSGHAPSAGAQDLSTQIMAPGAAEAAAAPPAMSSQPSSAGVAHAAVLRSAATGRVFFVGQGRTRVGHGAECQIKLGSSTDTVVARVHAELASGQDGSLVLWDAGSRTGTMVNGRRIAGVHRLAPGDRIDLGTGGPSLMVEEVAGVTASGSPSRYTPQGAERVTPAGGQAEQPAPAPARQPAAAEPQPATAKGAPQAPRRPSRAAGATMFFRQMIEDAGSARDKRFRTVLWTTVGGLLSVLIVGVGAVYMIGERRVRQAEAELARQGNAMAERQQVRDSIDRAVQEEAERLRAELTKALATGSAPTATLDSLRVMLSASESRTTRLEASLGRANSALSEQLAMGDSMRRQAQGDIARLRTEISRAGDDGTSRRLVDSLRRAIAEAEQQASTIGAQIRAVRGTNLARVSQENQGATGLVNTYVGKDVFDGSGFAVTASGFFITNRHVVITEGGARADSVFVVMADTRTLLPAEVVAVGGAQGPDLAVLRLRGYSGTFIRNIDWEGKRAAQGEPAALIGFPAGAANALDSSGTVRTSMSAGIFSKVTSDVIQFDGFTVGGSSGSPIFNAGGEVVAVHRAGLRQAAGLSFAVPVGRVVPLLPPAARAELGLK